MPKRKCPVCEEEMSLIESPQEIFAIPFTNFSIWDMGKAEYICYGCINDEEQEKQSAMREMFEEQAYNEGFEAGRNYEA